MNCPTPIPSATRSIPDPIGRYPRRRSFLVPTVLATFVLASTTQANLPPPAPDGGYPNGNTAEGANALFHLTTGGANTAIGTDALFAITSGSSNTAAGANALLSNTTGFDNTANGVSALQSNTTGHDNAATGLNALFNNTTGISNTADGVSALFSNTLGNDNTANGISALERNTSGSFNTATGASALNENTTGNDNTATGLNALFFNTTGHDNTADGLNALLNNTTGSNNIALGASAGRNLTSGSNNIAIGYAGVAGESAKIHIGTQGTQNGTFIAGIYGSTVSTGIAVLVGPKGKLGTVQSSARFKQDIKPMDKASEALLSLKPVTFRYKEELDPDGVPQFGLIAEQVEKVDPDLVVRDEDGKVNTVRYEAVNAMLLNEFIKDHRRAEDQRKQFEYKLADQQNEFEAKFAQQQKQIEALAVTVQKVSDQLNLSKPAPQVVANDQ